MKQQRRRQRTTTDYSEASHCQSDSLHHHSAAFVSIPWTFVFPPLASSSSAARSASPASLRLRDRCLRRTYENDFVDRLWMFGFFLGSRQRRDIWFRTGTLRETLLRRLPPLPGITYFWEKSRQPPICQISRVVCFLLSWSVNKSQVIASRRETRGRRHEGLFGGKFGSLNPYLGPWLGVRSSAS